MLLKERRGKVKNDQTKYENGYEQIVKTEKTIEVMQKNLEDLQVFINFSLLNEISSQNNF